MLDRVMGKPGLRSRIQIKQVEFTIAMIGDFLTIR